MQHHEERVSGTTIYEGKVFTVLVDQARLENGKIATREVVRHNGGAAVLALNENCEVAMVRQFRYAAGTELWEIPAGKLEAGEEAREAARRELEEEAGLVAERFEDFGSIFPTCAYCTEIIYLFLATKLRTVPCHLDEDEFVTMEWVAMDVLLEMIDDGRISDAKTVCALLKAERLLREGRLTL